MRFLISTILVVSTFVSAAMAQEADTNTASDLDLGAPVAPQVGQTYIREEEGDWAVRCVVAPEGSEDRCSLYQLLFDAEGNAIAEFTLFALDNDDGAVAGASIVVPLETLLTEGLILAVDGQNARQYPFRFCDQAGCVARVGFTAAEVDEFRRGISAAIVIVPAAAPDQPVAAEVSLLGFTAGFGSL